MYKPLVAIVGRPNVGKSAFFNVIAGQRIAIVKDTPGVTRDRIYADTVWNGRAFTLIDTGGIDTDSEDVLLSQMRKQAEIAIETADLICFFIDTRTGLTHQDEEIANILRRSRKPVLLVANKLDHAGLKDILYEAYALGLGEAVGISSTNMLGLGDLLDEIVARLPESEAPDGDEEHLINLAIVGRPNVGKSSLANRLLGEDRVMVSDIPGTTRDAIDTRFEAPDGTVYNVIDTAGIRRKRAIEDESVERYSVLRSIAAIHRCDVALLLMDAQDGVTEQDMRIAGMIRDEGKALVITINKWDLIEKETGTLEAFRKEVLSKLVFVSYAPVLFISALSGKRVQLVWDEISRVYAQATRHVPTGVLNDVLGDAQIAVQPPMEGGRRLKVYYATQQGTLPPSFLLFVNDAKLMHFAYERYLENKLRQAFDFTGTPIRFILREKEKGEMS
ncbi:MAG: ribosome biogenesis GTPase Der [Eubacteriales bacterium]|nr:ribosome biogenesis GTPase Der [Eubacteriales bacterium]